MSGKRIAVETKPADGSADRHHRRNPGASSRDQMSRRMQVMGDPYGARLGELERYNRVRRCGAHEAVDHELRIRRNRVL